MWCRTTVSRVARGRVCSAATRATWSGDSGGAWPGRAAGRRGPAGRTRPAAGAGTARRSAPPAAATPPGCRRWRIRPGRARARANASCTTSWASAKSPVTPYTCHQPTGRCRVDLLQVHVNDDARGPAGDTLSRASSRAGAALRLGELVLDPLLRRAGHDHRLTGAGDGRRQELVASPRHGRARSASARPSRSSASPRTRGSCPCRSARRCRRSTAVGQQDVRVRAEHDVGAGVGHPLGEGLHLRRSGRSCPRHPSA